MKKTVASLIFPLAMLVVTSQAQDIKNDKVPGAVKSALARKYPEAKAVSWEKEKGNYEANWGGRSGEDNSVQFTPAGEFLEMVKAVGARQLPAAAAAYIKEHYKGAKIHEAGRVTDAQGKTTYEAEVNKKTLVFDEKGNFVKTEE